MSGEAAIVSGEAAIEVLASPLTIAASLESRSVQGTATRRLLKRPLFHAQRKQRMDARKYSLI